MTADGVGNLLSGLAGTVPNTTYATSTSIVELTGVAARSVGVCLGLVFVVMAFIPKFMAAIIAIPGPVAAAYLVLLVARLFTFGIEILQQDGLDYRKSLMVGLAFWFGLAFQLDWIFPQYFQGAWSGLLGNAMTVGGLTVIDRRDEPRGSDGAAERAGSERPHGTGGISSTAAALRLVRASQPVPRHGRHHRARGVRLRVVNERPGTERLFTLLLALTASAAGAQAPAWTDDPLLPGVTPIKAVHFSELRPRINQLLIGCGGSAHAFADPVVRASETPVKAVHIEKLRTALSRAYRLCDRTPPLWSDPHIIPGVTPIKAVHLTELRAAVEMMRPIVSVALMGTTVLTAIGEAAQLSLVATFSDGSTRTVHPAFAAWDSSDTAVAIVAEGIVTAVRAGRATITVTYEEHVAELDISVLVSSHSEGSVRVLYAAPANREFRDDYSDGISRAIVDVQSWYREQLEGLTFEIYNVTPEWCQLPRDDDYYSRGNAWEKVLTDVQSCAPVRGGTLEFVWALYVDVDEECGGEPHELGAGGPGLLMMPRWDLEGLVSPGEYYYCDDGPYHGTLGRWYGGLAHELGHAFGVPHPPGCDEGLPACDEQALMWLGYEDYPNTYLRDDEKQILRRSPFIGTIHGAAAQSGAATDRAAPD